jgi:hypothetical protein
MIVLCLRLFVPVRLHLYVTASTSIECRHAVRRISGDVEKRVAFARAALLPSNGNEWRRERSRVSFETERWYSNPGDILLGGTEAPVQMWPVVAESRARNWLQTQTA